MRGGGVYGGLGGARRRRGGRGVGGGGAGDAAALGDVRKSVDGWRWRERGGKAEGRGDDVPLFRMCSGKMMLGDGMVWMSLCVISSKMRGLRD